MEYEVLEQFVLTMGDKKRLVVHIKGCDAKIGNKLMDENGAVFQIYSIPMICRRKPVDNEITPVCDFVLEGPALEIGKRVTLLGGGE